MLPRYSIITGTIRAIAHTEVEDAIMFMYRLPKSTGWSVEKAPLSREGESCQQGKYEGGKTGGLEGAA
jgi:hypothetical protein